MAPRATWKGHLKVGELAVPVSLFAAASTSDRISLHILNRETGNRVRREYVDEKTDRPVDRERQAKGFETAEGDTLLLEPEEIAAAVPESDKTIRIEAFVPCREVDTLYFDRPYFLAPPGDALADPFVVLAEGMRRRQVAALGRAVLFRRVRALFIRADGSGLVANTLDFDHEVRSATDAFDGLPDVEVGGEMLDLARHIISTKAGSFDPRTFEDRYDKALAELVKAKQEGRTIEAPRPPKETKASSLLDALRESAAASGKPPPRKAAARKPEAGKATDAGRKAAPVRRKKAG